MKEFASLIALIFVRSFFLSLSAVMMVLGFILFAPFPGFWKEVFTDGKS
ncbi:hypothetical protein G7D34_003709 [Salmonella enterica]|nr:hypothetical protein [Salmonella enterica]